MTWDCSMTLRIRRSMMPKLRARLEKVETARILDDENIFVGKVLEVVIEIESGSYDK